MKKELEEKVHSLVESLCKKAKKMKDPIEDVLDGNMVAESYTKETGTSAMAQNEDKKSKKGLKKCNDKSECGCDCDKDREETDDMEKTEAFVKSLMNNFQKISDAYLQKAAKAELEKARTDEGLTIDQKIAARKQRNFRKEIKTPKGKAKIVGTPKGKDRSQRLFEQKKDIINMDKKPKKPDQNTMPLAASEGEKS